MILAQLRHVPAAEWSVDAPIEHKDNILVSQVVREPDLATSSIYQREVCGFGL
jgi:hypothetical protein